MRRLAAALVDCGLDAQVALEVEDRLNAGEFDSPDYLSGSRTGEIEEHDDALMFRFGQVVIKHDDLQVMTHLGQSASAAAGIGFFTGHTHGAALYGAIAGMILGGLRLMNQMRRKAASVELDQYVILSLLKERPLSADELQAVLDAREPDLWPLEKVSSELARLRAVRLRDGNVAAFVAESDGKWATCGI